jgi:hypothetical protein
MVLARLFLKILRPRTVGGGKNCIGTTSELQQKAPRVGILTPKNDTL